MPVSSPNNLTYRSPRGSVIFIPDGMKPFGFGDVDMTRTADIQKNDIYSNEYATKTLVLSEVDQATYTLNITARNITDYLEMIEFLSDQTLVDQLAVPAGTHTEENVEIRQAIILGYRGVTVTEVTDGADVDYELNVDYTVDSKGGFITILAKPDGAGPNVVVKFTAPAKKRKRYFLGSKTEIRGRLIFIEATKPGREPTYHEYFSVGIVPDGDVQMISADGTRAVQMKATIYPDTSRPDGQNLAIIDGEYLA